jgi:hypothetical protein
MRSKIIFRLANSGADARTLSDSAPDFFAVSIAPTISSAVENRVDHKFDATCVRRFLEQLSSLRRGVLGVDDGRHAARPRGPDQSEFPAACRQALQGG